MPEDSEAQRHYERVRRTEERREQERLSLPNKRWARAYAAQYADCPF